MAGIQSCYRKLLVVGSSRVICKKGILYQPTRGRHNLVFQISLQRKNLFLSNARLNFGRQYTFRLASTDVASVTEANEASTTPKVPEPTANANAPSSTPPPTDSPSPNIVIDESTLPPVPTVGSDVPVMEFVTGFGEPSIKSLGLGSWWPTGLVQQSLEFLHINLDLPWWAAIATVTVILRVVTFPVTVSARKDTTNMMNYMPYISEFQKKVNEAKINGDYFLAATHMQELQQFIMEKKINLFSFIKPMLFQTPFFISMFWGLRGMAEVPVETFKTQGLFWFTDLTATDPYYILPAILSTSMFLIFKVGAEGVSLQSMNNPMLKIFLNGLPVVIFAVSTQFSTCVVWYWTISNLTVLMQTALLRVPAVSEFFKIPKRIQHDSSHFEKSKKGFIEEFKEGMRNAKLTKEVEERERLNSLTFEKAGTAAIPRTFKHNPKLANASKAVANKL